MKIETKLALKNMKKNKKRTIYTVISLVLCTTLILTTLLLISSIKNGIAENFDTEYNDYHVIFKNLSEERFNKIKDKSYIDKIYVQKGENKALEKVDSLFDFQDTANVYLKYKNIKEVCNCTIDTIKTLDFSELELRNIESICHLNRKLLTIHGFIDVYVGVSGSIKPTCTMRVDYSAIINLLVVTIIVCFSILFIIILYNAFLITISERKTEYAILNSIGGTEGQVLKMIFTEAIILGILGLVIGGIISTGLVTMILNNINMILNRAGYYFKLVFDIKSIIFSIGIIAINIYIAVLIPSVKASTTSVIQGIRNNNEIKNKKQKTPLEKILPIEGKVAIKNIKRTKSKYTSIILLFVICITTFIAISTYISYQKETADIVTEYDVDAEIQFNDKSYTSDNYLPILKAYERKYNRKLEKLEYKIVTNNVFVIEPENAFAIELENSINGIQGCSVIGLDEKSYNKYIKKVNGNYGDFIIYNNFRTLTYNSNQAEPTYTYSPIFKKNTNLKISIGTNGIYENGEFIKYESFKTEILNKPIILTDELIEGYNEIKAGLGPTLFMNMENYNELDAYIEKTYGKLQDSISDETPNNRYFWYNQNPLKVKIKCDNIIEFKNYMDIVIENDPNIFVMYYTLENQEKLMYIEIIELILKIIMIAIVTIITISTINTINASLVERKEYFNILYRLGTTKGNIRKMLIYEGIYMFFKALVISIIISVPIIYAIIKQTEKVIIVNKLLVPFGEIGIFVAILFAITILIMVYSSKMIKEE